MAFERKLECFQVSLQKPHYSLLGSLFSLPLPVVAFVTFFRPSFAFDIKPNSFQCLC